jgi:hypothetical protein
MIGQRLAFCALRAGRVTLEIMSNSPASRSWYKLSLRKLLVVVALCAIPGGWLIVALREGMREEEAAAVIVQANGVAEWDKNATGPAWLHDVLGEHFLRHVLRVTLQGDKVTDRTLQSLDAMNHLEELTLVNTEFSDVGTEHFQSLRELKELHIENAKIMNVGLKAIAGLKRLETLRLYGTQITDEGLEELGGMNRLQSLGLDGTNLNDAGLERLQRMRQLTSIMLIDTHVTPAGVQKLRQALPNCTISVLP